MFLHRFWLSCEVVKYSLYFAGSNNHLIRRAHVNDFYFNIMSSFISGYPVSYPGGIDSILKLTKALTSIFLNILWSIGLSFKFFLKNFNYFSLVKQTFVRNPYSINSLIEIDTPSSSWYSHEERSKEILIMWIIFSMRLWLFRSASSEQGLHHLSYNLEQASYPLKASLSRLRDDWELNRTCELQALQSHRNRDRNNISNTKYMDRGLWFTV